MIVEPMTDTELDGLRSKIFAYNRKERSRLRLFGQNVIRILARLDAERTRADAARQEGYREGVADAKQAAGFAAWRHEGDDARSQGMDAGARHQVAECVKAIVALSPLPAEPSAPVAPEDDTRCERAKALAEVYGIALQDVRSTVGAPEDANNWRQFLALADDGWTPLTLRAKAALEAAIKVLQEKTAQWGPDNARLYDRNNALEAENAALRERNEKLAKGLKPFAADAEGWADAVPDEHRPRCTEPGSDTAHPGSETAYTVGDLRRAHALLQGGPDAG